MYHDFLIQAFLVNEQVQKHLQLLHIDQVLLIVKVTNIHVLHKLEHKKQMLVSIDHIHL
jgi:hypothetical protein